MIAGVWHPSDGAAARALLRRLGGPAGIASDCGAGFAGVFAAPPARRLGVRHAFSDDVRGLSETELDAASATRLRGTFALVSTSRDGLIAARGVIGGRPLFVRRLPDGAVAVCSSFGRLAAIAPAPISPEGLCTVVSGVPPEDPRTTLHADIDRVLAGEVATFDASGVRRARLSPPTLPSRFRRMRADEAADEVWRLLRASVARAIAGRERVAVLASGGIDSSGVLAAAVAEAGAARVLAVTMRGDEEDFAHLQALCRSLGLTPIELRPEAVRGASVAPVLDGEPVADLGVGATMRETLRAHRADVVLCGQRGDDLLGEWPLASLHADASLARALWIAAGIDVPWQPRARDRMKRWVAYPRLVPLLPRALLARRRASRAYVPPWAGDALARHILDDARRVPRLHVGATPEARYCSFAFDDAWCAVAESQERLEHLLGIPLHDPLQDDDLLAFVASLPATTLLDRGLYRGLYRRALRGRVPESLRMRRTKGAGEPGLARVLAAGGGFDAIGDLASFEKLGALGVVDPAALRRAIDRMRSAPTAPETSRLWAYLPTILSLEAFLREPPARAREGIAAEVS